MNSTFRHRTRAALPGLRPAQIIPAILGLISLLLLSGAALAGGPAMVPSADGTAISYESSGSGAPALVFVHGWSCDARYFKAQVPVFSRKHQVVTLDLAGHGHSGMTRKDHTMDAFGQDVKAVVAEAVQGKIILIGHSMGGVVIAKAARLMPEKVLGLIGIDTLQNVEYPLTREALEGMTAPLKADFPGGCREFVKPMLVPATDPALREWILSDMAAAPPRVAVSAMENMLGLYLTGETARIFEGLKVPVITVNADLWPVNAEANRRHMHAFKAVTLKGTDHFLMLGSPDRFNAALEKAIRETSRQ